MAFCCVVTCSNHAENSFSQLGVIYSGHDEAIFFCDLCFPHFAALYFSYKFLESTLPGCLMLCDTNMDFFKKHVSEKDQKNYSKILSEAVC